MSALTLESCARSCVDFINRSPSPFHAVDSCIQRLKQCGFIHLSERDSWKLQPKGKYFFTRNESTIVAFAVGGKYASGNGVQIVAAHTDSPHPKVKPVSARKNSGYLQVGVELYGGGLWHTWFDRDLAVAGRVVTKQPDGTIASRLVNIDRPLMRIPTLAIHLCTGEERRSFAYNKEDHVMPILATEIKGAVEGEKKSHHPLLMSLVAKELSCDPNDISDFELSIYDHHKATVGGACEEFVFAARLDNLGSSFCALEAMVDSCQDDAALGEEEGIRLICLFDHEECGSQSAQGAASTLLERLVIRLSECFANGATNLNEVQEKTFRNSFLVSADMAHGVHPNYSSKHEQVHRPALHTGTTIKYNSNQRYATNSVTTALLRAVAAQQDLPIQEFVVRNDCPCGTTVGPILAANTGIRTIDIGAPQLSMHSIREMCGTDDLYHYYALMKLFLETFQAVDKNFSVDKP